MPGRVAVKRHEPARDGIRAFAVTLVIAYHGDLPGLRAAGFLGVDIFFVLSGFLITRLLLDEEHQRARITFGGFWARRARRLLPALLVVIVAVQGLGRGAGDRGPT